MLTELVGKKREQPDASEHANDKKRRKLHEQRVAGLPFSREALDDPSAFVQKSKNTFGLGSEALYRECYDEILEDIGKAVTEKWENGSFLVEVRGSAGIGKSAFLALTMALELQDGMKSFALFHAPKASEDEAYPTAEVKCSVWIDGELKMDGARYGLDKTQEELDTLMKKLEVIYMDGCSMVIDPDFKGLIMVAAPPSVSTRGLRKSFPGNYVIFYMPPWSEKEYVAAGKLLDVDETILKENYHCMNGIIRYAFRRNGAREKVEEAVKDVNPSSISRLVASNETNKETEKYMVHSLVLWTPKEKEDGRYDYTGDVSFSLVSRFAERIVAKILMDYELSDLRDARRRLSAVSGAEGYAGALFEAYAIKKICNGGKFTIFKNDGQQPSSDLATINVPPLEDDPIVLRTNKLDKSSLPFDTLREKTAANKFKPRLVWPETNNFSTFDAYYLHEDGELYSLQMTVAREDGFLKHSLDNGGAYQTMQYLDAVHEEEKGSVRKYKAVFVVPTPSDRCRSKKTKVYGRAQNGEKYHGGRGGGGKNDGPETQTRNPLRRMKQKSANGRGGCGVLD